MHGCAESAPSDHRIIGLSDHQFGSLRPCVSARVSVWGLGDLRQSTGCPAEYGTKAGLAQEAKRVQARHIVAQPMPCRRSTFPARVAFTSSAMRATNRLMCMSNATGQSANSGSIRSVWRRTTASPPHEITKIERLVAEYRSRIAAAWHEHSKLLR